MENKEDEGCEHSPKVVYCNVCKELLCDDCEMEHIERGHSCAQLENLAAEYRQKMTSLEKMRNVTLREYQDKTLEAQTKHFSEAQQAFEQITILSHTFEENSLSELKLMQKEINTAIKEFQEQIAHLTEEKRISRDIQELDTESLNNFLKFQKKADEHESWWLEEEEELERGMKEIINKISLFMLKYETISNLLKNTIFLTEKKLHPMQAKMISEISDMLKIFREQKNHLKRQVELNVELQIEALTFTLEIEKSKALLSSMKSRKEEFQAIFEELNKKNEYLKAEITLRDKMKLELEQKVGELSEMVFARKSFIETMNLQVETKLAPRKFTDDNKVEATKIHEEMQFEEYKTMSKSNLLYCYDHSINIFIIYIPVFSKHFILTRPNLTLNSQHDSAQINDIIFLSGGFDQTTMQYSDSFEEVDIIKNEKINVKKLQNMLVPRSQHRMVILNLNAIFVLGGKNKKCKFLNSCEYYNIKMNKWEHSPSMNERKFKFGVSAFNCKTIYVFGGFNEVQLGTIEHFTPSEDSKWSFLKLASSEGWKPRGEAGAIQLSPNEIIIFGGCVSIGYSEEVFIFFPKERKMTKAPAKLRKKDSFSASGVSSDGVHFSSIGYFNKDIHQFNLEKREWSLLEKPSWYPDLQQLSGFLIYSIMERQ